jgi:N-acetyl-gamma-glutamyl-phosphate reductase
MSEMKRIPVSIIGVTGYTGGELYRLLLSHPGVEVVEIAAKSKVAEPISAFFPNLKGVSEQTIVPIEETSRSGIEAVFLSTPHGAAMDLAGDYLDHGIKVIDISGDHRLRDAAEFQAWYGMPHTHPERLSQAVYGLPELFRSRIRKAGFISNPGCYPTASILAVAPLVKNALADLGSLVIDSKSGVSGAGRKPGPLYHLPECGQNFTAYKIAAHQHTPEIEQVLSDLAGKKIQLSFVPHLLPISRGILTTAYADLSENLSLEDLRQAYRDFYRNEPFIRLREEMNRVSLGAVVGSNFCDIGVFLDDRLNRAIVVSVIDNLVKGAAGQAIQNFNLLFGFEETLGLERAGWLI